MRANQSATSIAKGNDSKSNHQHCILTTLTANQSATSTAKTHDGKAIRRSTANTHAGKAINNLNSAGP
jgi:phosphomannomutase